MDVMILYESLGVKICGLVCNGGGGNSKFIWLLRCNLPGLHVWPDSDNDYWTYPLYYNRHMYIWSCATHSLKATRNTLYRSQHKLSRKLTRKHVTFGWK